MPVGREGEQKQASSHAGVFGNFRAWNLYCQHKFVLSNDQFKFVMALVEIVLPFGYPDTGTSSYVPVPGCICVCTIVPVRSLMVHMNNLAVHTYTFSSISGSSVVVVVEVQ